MGQPPGVWIALGAVYLVWGSTYLAIRVAINTIPPFTMGGFRFLVAGALLFGFASRRRGDLGPDPLRARHWRSAFIVGGSLLLGGNGLVSWAVQRVSSGTAALLVATTPLWLALFDRLVYGRRLGRLAVAGLAVGFAGVALLVSPRLTGSPVDPMGAATVLLAAMFWAGGSLYSRRATLPRRALVGTGMQMLAGGSLMVLTGLLGGEASRIRLESVSPASATAVGYLIVFGSLVAFTSYLWLLRVAPISLVSTYAYVNPVVAVILGWVILHEPLTPGIAAAAGVIVAGVAMIVVSTQATRRATARRQTGEESE